MNFLALGAEDKCYILKNYRIKMVGGEWWSSSNGQYGKIVGKFRNSYSRGKATKIC